MLSQIEIFERTGTERTYVRMIESSYGFGDLLPPLGKY